MIQVGFSTHRNSLLSWLIRKLTRSEASHAWILLDETYFGTQMVLESVGIGGFRLVTYDLFKKQKNRVIALVDPGVDLEPGVHEAAQWLGTSYDHLGFFGAGIAVLGRWIYRRWHNPFRSASSQFCSEAVVRILQTSHCPGADSLDPETTTPQDLLDFLALRAVVTRFDA